jgi:hypothetical protein
MSQDPDRYNFLVSSRYHPEQYSASHPHIDAYRSLILEEAHKLFELIAGILTSRIINEPTLTIHPKTA